MLPLAPKIAIQEMEGIKTIIEKWLTNLNEGVPTLTFEARDEDFEMYMKQWIGELRLLAGKADNLADILSGVR